MVELDLGNALGVAEDASVERLTLYIPSQDRDGHAFDPHPWIDEALRLMSMIGGGATAAFTPSLILIASSSSFLHCGNSCIGLGARPIRAKSSASSKASCLRFATITRKATMAEHEPNRSGVRRRVTVVGATKRRIDRTGLSQALGAATSASLRHTDDTPLGFVAVRQKLMNDRRSTGGRPGFADAERRKIPIPAAVWRLVADAAAEMAEPGFQPSPAQVASAILSIAVHHLNPQIQRDAKHALKASRSLRSPRADAREAQ